MHVYCSYNYPLELNKNERSILIIFDTTGRSKSPLMRKSKIFDASGNGLVKPGKKIVNRKSCTNDQCDNKRKSTSSEVTPISCSEDVDKPTETVGSKSLMRRPTFKEFEGKFRNSKGSRLLKSQSLDQEPGMTCSRPTTPGCKTQQQQTQQQPRTGLKSLSRRARDVFLNNNQHQQTEVISSKPSFMGRFFQR